MAENAELKPDNVPVDDEEEGADEPEVTPAPEPEPEPAGPEIVEDDDEEGEDDVVLPRGIKAMPLAKFKKYEDKWKTEKAELEKKLEDANRSRPAEAGAELSKIATELAEKHNADPALIEAILGQVVSIASQKSKLPDELVKKLEGLGSLQESQQQDALFEKEFAGLVKSQPEAAGVKGKLKELAFTDGKLVIDGVKYAIRSIPLRVLYEVGGFKAAKKKAGESSKGGIGTPIAGAVDYANLTPEQVKKLSTKPGKDGKSEFDKYSEWLEKQNVTFTL